MIKIPQEVKEQAYKDLAEYLKKQPLIQKYIKQYSWASGSCTNVYPLEIRGNEITIQLSTDKNYFTKFLKRTEEEFRYLVTWAEFENSDGSCPCTLHFWFNKEFCYS